NTDTAVNKVLVADAALSPGNPVNAGAPQQFIGGNTGNAASAAAAFANFKAAIGGVDNAGAAPAAPPTTGLPDINWAGVKLNGIDVKLVLPSAHTTSLVSGASRGFGALFENVTIANSSSIEYFNGSTSLGKFFVPPGPKRQAEFLGVLFDNPIVTNVALTLGT